jgi:hypothetical protein
MLLEKTISCVMLMKRRKRGLRLGEHAFAVVGLLHLDECERHAIDEQGNVRPKFIVAVLAGQLGDDMKAVVVEVLEVDQPSARALGKAVVEGLSKVFVVQEQFDVGQQPGDVICCQFRVDACDGFAEKRGEDIGLLIPGRALQ